MARVLYAEDEPQISQMVEMLFASMAPECALEIVGSGTGCLERMAAERFDVVLVDLIMPGLDGLQVLGELASRRDPTPVIMVSSHGQTELAVKALRAGAVDCIDKNSSEFRQIPAIVRRVHARRKSQTALPWGVTEPKEARVLLVEGDRTEAAHLERYFSLNAPSLRLRALSPADFETMLRGPIPGEALVLGPGLGQGAALDLLRKVRSRDADLPVVVLASAARSETAVAAFKLGAQDFILHQDGGQMELVFALNHALRHASDARVNRRLTRELAELNHSLEAQVAVRTKELQALSSRLLQIQEAERRAIARELHDQIGQMLTALRLQLEAVQRAGANLGEPLALTDDILRGVRGLSLQLCPRILDDLGLQPALEWHLDAFRRQTGLAVGAEIALPPERLPPETERAAFRLVQEALTNVARHARGAVSSVTALLAADGHLIIEVSDRGPGFDVAQALARHDSLGLAGLMERVRLAGGRVELFSEAGQGTRIHAEFPLPPAPDPSP